MAVFFFMKHASKMILYLNNQRMSYLTKIKMFKTMLERFISFLQLSKSQIVPAFKDKLAPYEKQIIEVLNSNRPRKPVSSIPTQGLPPPHMHLMQQSP
ncbi:hypothetical protein LguiB_020412 [Lonicera macranthoides]